MSEGFLNMAPEDQAKSDSMMKVMDAINRKMGKGSVTVAFRREATMGDA